VDSARVLQFKTAEEEYAWDVLPCLSFPSADAPKSAKLKATLKATNEFNNSGWKSNYHFIGNGKD
jgi:hypothetical protein